MQTTTIIGKIKAAFRDRNVYVSQHADNRLKERDFDLLDILTVSESFELIKEYFDDKPFPSYLLLGRIKTGRPFHLVVAWNTEDKTAVLITLYEPLVDEWENDFKTRRKL